MIITKKFITLFYLFSLSFLINACAAELDTLYSDNPYTGLPQELGDKDLTDPIETDAQFIGEACKETVDCAYDNGVCISSLTGGMCSLSCDKYCPDSNGKATTFCVDASEIEQEEHDFLEGICASQCDFILFPENGCRENFGCVERQRYHDETSKRWVCIPDVENELVASDCLKELHTLGINAIAEDFPDRHPKGSPEFTCHVDDPIILRPPLHGLLIKDYDGSVMNNVHMACNAALSLIKTVDDVKELEVREIVTYGTYNCRKIAGKNKLSRHSFGDAIDIKGFVFEDDSSMDCEEDWEHDTTEFQTAAGQFLYNAGQRWFANKFWNIVLTPNYNKAHDNHFHLDMTPGSDFLGLVGNFDNDMGPSEER